MLKNLRQRTARNVKTNEEQHEQECKRGHKQRRSNVDATSCPCVDVDATLYKRHLFY